MATRPRTALDDGSTPERDASVLVSRFGETVTAEVDDFFAAWGITVLQFNVLRILYLRDPGQRGISRGSLEARLMRRVPDVTRLLDRLETAGLIHRFRPHDDRRAVLAALTDKGFDLVERTHAPLLQLNRRQMAHLSRDELAQLIALLRKALDRPAERKR